MNDWLGRSEIQLEAIHWKNERNAGFHDCGGCNVETARRTRSCGLTQTSQSVLNSMQRLRLRLSPYCGSERSRKDSEMSGSRAFRQSERASRRREWRRGLKGAAWL